MSNADNPLTVYLTDAEKQQLERWAEKTGKSLSQLGRDAILEYTDRDRVERIEQEVSHIHEELANLRGSLEETANTHTQDPVNKDGNSSVPEKARAVADHIYTNYEMPIKEDDVELAIENIARVGDKRSVARYKDQIKKRDLLFRHPFQPVWTDDKEQWVKWVEGSQVADQSHEIIGDYQMDMDEYDKLRAGITQ